MNNSTDSLNETHKHTTKAEQDASCLAWGDRKSLIEFVMLENRCSYSRAVVIIQDSEELRERRRNELA